MQLRKNRYTNFLIRKSKMNQTISVLKNLLEDRKIKDKQLSSLRSKEVKFIEKESELSKLLEKTQSKHDDCIRLNLSGNISDQQLGESKNNLKELTNDLQEVKENLRILTELKAQLMTELSFINGDIDVHRAIFCGKLAEEKFDKFAKDRKLHKKLVDYYAIFYRSTTITKGWEHFLPKCFAFPSEVELQTAFDKLKESNEFLRD